ncbi:MAG TPA: VWA domain-containing protein [Nocardioides sp.]|uniref:vWA domain-containing protein n=1 Tax=Nocardioides sp. TaxID=35761 RepID=UPI002D0A11AD|nr:VWA domain-containing protein [Nocardioides sp.]HTW18322.1 VWA domain-containing protein [Nocardioides sp.]
MMLQPIWPILISAVVLLAATAVWAWRHWPRQSRGSRLTSVLRILLAVAAVVVGLHPVGALQVEVPRERPVDIVVVLDRTTSMGAQDWERERPRMSGAAADLDELIRTVAGSRVAVVVFDDEARLAVPFTTDATTLSGFWRTAGWRPSTKASGSDISVAAGLTTQVLREAKEERPGHSRYLIYLGDGEQTAETPPASFAPARELVSGALVLGYGSRAGGPMTTSPESAELIRLDGEVQLSRIDEGALKAIAEQLGAEYRHRTSLGDLPELTTEGAAPIVTETVPGQEYYWIVALAAALGLLALIGLCVTGIRSAREELNGAH